MTGRRQINVYNNYGAAWLLPSGDRTLNHTINTTNFQKKKIVNQM